MIEWVRHDPPSCAIDPTSAIWHATMRRTELGARTECGLDLPEPLQTLTPLIDRESDNRCKGCVALVVMRSGDRS